MKAFQAISLALREWKPVAASSDFPAPAAASVTIRYEGKIIGRGQEVSANPSGDAEVIVRAAETARTEASQRAPIERDALFEDNLRALAPRFALTIELAGPFIPFAPREYADAAIEVAPGLEGVAVRLGDRVAPMFPEAMLAGGTDAGSALGSLVSRLSGDATLGLTKPADLSKDHGAVFYRFRATVIAQPGAGVPPMFLHRGGRVIPQSEISEAELRRWAQGLAQSLELRSLESASAATYDPVHPATPSELASPADQLLCSMALGRFADVNGAAPAAASSAQKRSQALFDQCVLFRLKAMEGQPFDLAATTLADIRFFQGGFHQEGEALQRYARVLDVQGATKMALGPDGKFLSTVPPAAKGLVAFDFAKRDDPKQAELIVRETFRETEPGALVSQMPWLGWAELKLHPTGDIPSAIALRDMRDMVWQHQLKGEDLPPDQQDFAGGIMFTTSRQPLPTWQGARPLAFIAMMLGDERLTPRAEVPAELAHLLSSLRFLHQLSAGEAECHMYANPEQARWGVRASPFDQQMPPEATAFTLITVCETLQTLDKLKQRQSTAEPVAH